MNPSSDLLPAHLLPGPVEPLLTTRQVADRVGVSEATMRYWRHLGSGPVGYKIGRHVRYAPNDVDAWLADRRDRANAA